METKINDGPTNIRCPDCGTALHMDFAGELSPRLLAWASKTRCGECSDMRRCYEAAETVAKKALRNAESLAVSIKQLTKHGEQNLVPTQKEELWKNTETMQRNLDAYKLRVARMREIAAKFKLRTGMQIR